MSVTKASPTGSYPPDSVAQRLDSWKEIAAYLRRDERTVRRWETEGLPVHRHLHKKKAAVYAYKEEIDTWWKQRQPVRPASAWPPPPAGPSRTLLWLSLGSLAVALASLSFLIISFVRTGFFPPVAGPQPRAVAVLPVVASGGSAEEAEMAAGLTDALITGLAKTEGLQVVSRTARDAERLREIARALRLAAVVGGRVTLEGDRVRVTVELRDAARNRHLWREEFDYPAGEGARVSREISTAVARRVQFTLEARADGISAGH